MKVQLIKKSHRSLWPARLGKIFSAATVVVLFMLISVLFLSLSPCPTDLADEARLHSSAQFSSGPGIILNYDQFSNNFRELKSSCVLNDSLKSEDIRPEIYHCEELFQAHDTGNRRVSNDKSATPGFVCRWLLNYHRNHK